MKIKERVKSTSQSSLLASHFSLLSPFLCALGAATWLACVSCCSAADWPQWRGPQRNGTTEEADWLQAWPERGAPRVAWRASVGKGHSAVSVSGGLAYTLGWDGAQDTVICLSAATGEVRWRQSYPCKTIVQWPGPRATATVDGGTVFTLGQHGQLRAWDAQTGARKWRVDLPAEQMPDVDYGFAWSPLVEGDLLLLSAGAAGLALDKRDGRVVWGGKGQGACASPVPFIQAGQRAVAMLTTDTGRESVSLLGVEPASGRELWRFGPWKERWGAACSDPVIADGCAFITTAEQHKRCALISFAEKPPREVWAGRSLSSYTCSPVLLDGHLYGVDNSGKLKCLEWRTGRELWAQPGFDEQGSLISAGGKLLVQSGKSGLLVAAEAAPAGYRELRRVQVFEGKPATFTAPALAHGRLYCRSYLGEVVCFDFSGAR